MRCLRGIGVGDFAKDGEGWRHETWTVAFICVLMATHTGLQYMSLSLHTVSIIVIYIYIYQEI